MKRTRWPVVTGALSAIALYAGAATAAPIYPTPNPPFNSLVFGDFTVYSLPFLTFRTGTNFDVQSSAGQIKDDIVLMTGASGLPVNTNVAGMDNAFPSTTGSTSFFSTAVTADPGGAGEFTGDTGSTWDARTSALRGYLNAQAQHDLVFYFNLNETGNDGLAGIDLHLWARVTLKDDQGIAADKVFYFTGDPLVNNGLAGKLASIANGPPAVNPDTISDAQWATAHGTICVDSVAKTLTRLGPCQNGDPNPQEINQNLGSDHAAFAAFNQDLNDEVKNASSPYDVMQIDFRLAQIDNGFEQVFIQAATVTQVAEPSALAIIGMGLAGLGLMVRRRSA